MENFGRPATLGIRLPSLLAVTLLAIAAGGQAETPGIQVTGVGEVLVVPDLARVSLAVRREGPDAAVLKTELDRVTAAVLQLTSALQIDAGDVTAAGIDIHPRYRHHNGESVVEGVVASRTILVTLRDLEQIGEFVNGALLEGVNGVSGIELDAANRRQLEAQALDLAIDDAQRQATRVAARFEVELGPLLEAGGAAPPQPIPLMMDAMAAAAPESRNSFEPGQMTIRREIFARFAIEARQGPR